MCVSVLTSQTKGAQAAVCQLDVGRRGQLLAQLHHHTQRGLATKQDHLQVSTQEHIQLLTNGNEPAVLCETFVTGSVTFVSKLISLYIIDEIHFFQKKKKKTLNESFLSNKVTKNIAKRYKLKLFYANLYVYIFSESLKNLAVTSWFQLSPLSAAGRWDKRLLHTGTYRAHRSETEDSRGFKNSY